MLSVLAQRVAFRLPTLAAPTLLRSRAPLVASQTALTRTFLTTPQLAFPAAKAKATTTASAPKTKKALDKPNTTATKSTKTVKKPTKAAKPKAEPKAKKEKAPPKPKRLTIRPEDRPPKMPAGPWLLFWKRYMAGRGIKSLDETHEVIKEASSTWRAMSEAEKQPFRDESAAARVEYAKRRNEYFTTVDRKILNELNRRRTARDPNASRLRRKSKNSGQPAPPFVAWFNETFRQRYATENPDLPARDVAKHAGEVWRGMSDGDKQPHVDRARQAIKEWKAKQQA
ncbi:uncharacterized protein PHACADRAFT_259183 [Phanerochaete carnosa HHB-10118-sp]|uniref:HMG box domain-containing protein n=1 Tax=Phanerochaete carnosa (strain HHB-10118-sp) TaxID=650164 RepID=K5USU9_PHACS|nr:uncharacterized protein PHACADRAFT_259183 [Phanerochaete carnosa HHB-10118-sp]EKM53011.1 hypothetical protein PHACADRAFT_259183 [Phanerochaete carnosa HHB-10118-sp]